MKKLFPIALVLFGCLTGCTISILQSHTSRGSSESTDLDQDANPTVNPSVTIPLK